MRSHSVLHLLGAAHNTKLDTKYGTMHNGSSGTESKELRQGRQAGEEATPRGSITIFHCSNKREMFRFFSAIPETNTISAKE